MVQYYAYSGKAKHKNEDDHTNTITMKSKQLTTTNEKMGLPCHFESVSHDHSTLRKVLHEQALEQTSLLGQHS